MAKKNIKLRQLREFTKRSPALSKERYEKAITETKDPAVIERLQQILKATEAKKVRDTAVQLVTPSYRRGLSPGTRKLDTKVSAVAKKLINLAAPKGFVKEMTRTAGTSRGRGRPKKSYKLRFVPGVGAVRVPTAIYNKMMSAAKAKQRLAAAQRQANIQQQYESQQIAAEQVAMQQDPRFQPKDRFLEEPDMEHEQRVMQAQQQVAIQEQMQQQQMEPEQQGIASRAGQMFGKARIALMGTERERPVEDQQVPQIRRPDVPEIHKPQIDPNLHQPISPQVLVTRGKSPMFSSGGPSILNQRNEFNERNRATVGFGR